MYYSRRTAFVQITSELGLDPNDLKLLQAILIAFILSLPLLKKLRANGRYRKGVENHA